MAAAKIKKGDQVVVIAGKDRKHTGEVLKVLPKENKVVVSGANIKVRHAKPTQADPQGGLKRSEAPMHVSNVAHVVEGSRTRVRFETQDGKKVRVAVKTGNKIDG